MGKHFWFKFSLEIILIIQFGISTSLTRRIILRTVNLHLNPLDTSKWENYGFEKVTRNLENLKNNNTSPTSFFMASKGAKLVTQLTNFDGDSLYINFSWMIGKSVNPKPTTTTTPRTTTTIPTPAIVVMKLHVPSVPQVESLEPQTVVASSASVPSLPIPESVNSNDSHGHTSSIIQISLDPSNPELKTEIHKIMRKKRELDSKDILQIHQMIKSANANGTSNLSSQTLSEQTPESVNREMSNSGLPAVNFESKPQLQIDNIGQAYKYWRSSTISKNVRPPGFYLTINDEVVFDNWSGVWNNMPNVIGKWSSNPQAQISNRTTLLYTWDNVLTNRTVKVSFEWEPVDSSMFLFLDDISISTYEGDPGSTGKRNTEGINNRIPSVPASGVTDAGNKNITIYIVVKSEAGDTTTRHAESISSNATEMTTTTETTTITAIPQSVKSGGVRNESNKNNYPVIVLAVLGCTFLVILVFILWVKINGGKRCAGIPC